MCSVSVAKMHLGCWYLPLTVLAVEENFRGRNSAVVIYLKCSSKVLGKLPQCELCETWRGTFRIFSYSVLLLNCLAD